MALASSEAANPHWTPRAGKAQLEHIPGEHGLPVFGTTLRTLRNPSAYTDHLFRSYGKVARVNTFGSPGVMLFGAEANELVLFDREKLFSSEQGWGPTLNLLFPRGLMLLDFDRHRLDRKALGIAFKPEPMRGYLQDIHETFSAQMGKWRGTLTIYNAIKQITLDVAAKAFLGVPLGPEADKVNAAFVDMVQASIGVVRAPVPFTKMAKGVAGRKYLIDFFGPQIAERRRNENRTDMFSQFCRATREDGGYLSDGELVDHINFLMMAAHDTITSSLTSMIWFLAKNPEWQEKLRSECLSIAPAGVGLTGADLEKFEITEMVFKETMRLLPPVPSIPRRSLRDFEFMGYQIPAGTLVGLSPGYVHKMAEYWEEPEKFDPLRHSAEQSKARHKYAFVPFGGGAHMCLGLHFAHMQVKLFTHHLLTQVRISVAEDYAPKWQVWPMPKPTDGLQVTLTAL